MHVDHRVGSDLAWYQDLDGDGFGNPGATSAGCVAASGYVADDSDCNDLSYYVNPDALESCNSIDDDCDGLTDDEDPDRYGASGTAWTDTTASPSASVQYTSGSLGLATDITYVGDMDSDGADDFVIGAGLDYRSPNTYAGSLLLFTGGLSGRHSASENDGRAYGAGFAYDLGWSVSGGGIDATDDGKFDILGGAPGNNAAYLYSGSWTGEKSSSVANATFTGASENFGIDVFVCFGPFSGTSLAADYGRFTGYSGAEAGYALSAADVNDDGVEDIAVGGPAHYASTSYTWMIYGSGL